jgi:NADH-quinone oxidoreductase subunit N
MLSLAGIPGTVGFIGKFQLIHALVSGDYTWLAIVLVVGSMISLGYYLRVVAAMWMSAAVQRGMLRGGFAPIAGGSPEADEPPAGRESPVPFSAGGYDPSTPPPPEPPSPPPAPPVSREPLAEPEIVLVGALFAGACVFFGIVPGPLFHLAAHAGHAISGLF